MTCVPLSPPLSKCPKLSDHTSVFASTEPEFVNLEGAHESIPSLAGRYDDPIWRTCLPGYVGCGIESLESISVLLKRLQIWAQGFVDAPLPPPPPTKYIQDIFVWRRLAAYRPHLTVATAKSSNKNWPLTPARWDSFTQGLINYRDTKAKCRHLKILTCKGTLQREFIRVYRQSVMLVFSTQLCQLLPL